MEILLVSFFFILGAIFGSFYNVVGLRLPKAIPFHRDRSYCPTCQRQLRAFELIPIVSYLIQGGSCRRCQERISPLYPIMETITGLLFAFAYWQIGLEWELILALLLISLAVILTVTDLVYMLIPNKILLFFLPFLVIYRILFPLDPWYDMLIGGIVGYGLILVIIIVSKGGMGAGDMKLLGLLGLVLGWKLTLLSFFIATLFGAVIGGLLMARKKLKRGEPMPFGPYLLFGSLISYFFGEQIVTFYLNLL